MDASNYMSPDEVERLVVYTYVYTYILYLSIYHTLTCMYDMILRPRIPRPHLGCNWSGSHVKSNPLPIELFSSIGRVLLSVLHLSTIVFVLVLVHVLDRKYA